MHRTHIRWFIALLPCLFGSPAWANHFTFRRDLAGGQERGIVVSHGMDLFVITTSAGGYTPARRAEIIARRLEELSEDHGLEAGIFSVGFRNGEIILQQQEHAEHQPHIIVTVDRRLARRGAAERLAHWWLALLRDNFSLAMGRKPVYTADTPIGATFERVYAALGAPAEPIPAADIIRAVEALPESDRQVFRTAATFVPASFSPDRLPVADIAVPRQISHHREEADQGHNATQEPTKRSRPKQEPSNDDEAGHYRIGEEPAAEHENPARRTETPRRRPKQTSDALVQRSGRYKVILVTEPKSIGVSKPTTIQIKLADDAAGEEPIKGATVRGWLVKRGEKSTPPVSAEFNEEAGTYDLPLTFASAGDYRLTVGILTENEDVFKVGYTFFIGASDAADDSKASPADSGRVPASKIRRVGIYQFRRVGIYQFRLTVNPIYPAVGEEAKVELKIVSAAAQAPLSNATVKGWFVAEGRELAEVEPILAVATEDAGVYGWQLKLPKAGKYYATVAVETDTGRKFRVQFPVAITIQESDREVDKRDAQQTQDDKAEPENPDQEMGERP